MNPALEDLSYNQNTLQDFSDCPRRFELKHVRKLIWPAVEEEPIHLRESRQELGTRFHDMVHQYFLGIDGESIARSARDETLERWWETFLDAIPKRLEGMVYPEITLAGRIGPNRITATYDLIVVLPNGRLEVYDWKTSVRRPPTETVAARLQTRVYPWLLVQAGAALTGKPVKPPDIALFYWYCEYPDQPLRFEYDVPAFQHDDRYLSALVERVAACLDGGFELTDDVERCRYCVYRSYCDRGTVAPVSTGDRDLESEPIDLFDLDDIEEIPL